MVQKSKTHNCNPDLFPMTVKGNSIRNRTNLTLAIQRVFVTLFQYMHVTLIDNVNRQKPAKTGEHGQNPCGISGIHP